MKKFIKISTVFMLFSIFITVVAVYFPSVFSFFTGLFSLGGGGG